MKAARPLWLLWLGVVVGVAATARLGVWQLDRAAQKMAIERTLAERTRMPALPAGVLARDAAALAPQLHRRIAVSGRWLAQHTIYLDNRPLDGRAGFIVVTPLLLGPHDAVLVQRGWAPRDRADRARVPAASLPPGEVRLEARIAAWPSQRLELTAVDQGAIRQNLEPAQLAIELGMPLRPLSLLQLADAGERDPLVREWPVPVQDVWKNQGYALQWFALSALIAGLALWFRVIRPRREQAS
ncbi:MAG: SURF1 family protein [Ideonella sp.]|nr:SURF1 family protein [Ideonella sp.]MCC7456857.1 SURF1 family protein [Nitrospira sp.]